MLALVLMTVLSTATAQDQEADVAAPEPAGCWGTASSPFPAQDATDVPLDISPRFYLDGRCADAVQIELVDALDAQIEVTVDAQEHGWGTTVIVTPTSELDANTQFIMTITTEFGNPTELRFTTGDDVSTPGSDLEVLDVMADGWCTDREEASYSLLLQVGSTNDGLAGYVSSAPTSPFNWEPILVQNGRADIWTLTDARIGEAEACASIARIEDDGTIGEWEEVCAPTPDVGDCRERRQFLGCGARPQRGVEPVPMAALLFLPLLGLLGVRRRRQD